MASEGGQAPEWPFLWILLGEDVENLQAQLDSNPELDVNLQEAQTQSTILHFACRKSYVGTARMLVRHPRINVNALNRKRSSPFLLASAFGEAEIARILMVDRRVDVNLPDENGRTALWWMVNHDDVDQIQWLIATRSDLRLDIPGQRTLGAGLVTPRELAVEKSTTQVSDLLKKFEVNPAETRHRLRLELGIAEAAATSLFVEVVFLSDDYLRIPETNDEANQQGYPGQAERVARARRFFRVSMALPMDLQMVLCNRTFGLTRENIGAAEFNAALVTEARSLI